MLLLLLFYFTETGDHIDTELLHIPILKLKELRNACTILNEKISRMPMPKPTPAESEKIRIVREKRRTIKATDTYVRRSLLYHGPPTVEIDDLFQTVRDSGFVTRQAEINGESTQLDFYNIGHYTCSYYETTCEHGSRINFVLKREDKIVTTEVQCTSASPPGTDVSEVTITKFLVADHSAALHALQCILQLYSNTAHSVIFQYIVNSPRAHDAGMKDDHFEAKLLRFFGFKDSEDKSLSRLTLAMPSMIQWLGMKNPHTLCSTICGTQIAYALYRYAYVHNLLTSCNILSDIFYLVSVLYPFAMML